MRLAYHRRNEVLQFVTSRIRHPLNFNGVGFEAIGVEDERGHLKAGALFYHYRPVIGGYDIEISGATERGWYTRTDGPALLRETFLFLYVQLACLRVTAITPKAHRRARKFLEHIGFRQEGIHHWGLGYRKTAVAYGLTFDACPWISTQDKSLIEARIKDQMHGRFRATVTQPLCAS